MIMVDVAQLVELRIVTPAVEGSNPFVHPISSLSGSVLSFIPSVPQNPTVGSDNAERDRINCESGGIGRRAGFRFQWGNL